MVRLYQADDAIEAAHFAIKLANNPMYARLCLMQLGNGAWAVCLYRD